jgi:hypothetical protein
MTLQDMRDFIAAHTWTFAKSMPQMPHFYVVRDKCRADDEFVQAVTFIRKYGVPRPFFRKTYIYLDIDGWSYWTMGNPMWDTTIINRAEIKCE